MGYFDFYSNFEKDQVLTHEQLNLTVGYLERHERLTRRLLIGAGIVCGLRLMKPIQSGKGVVMTRGVASTTQGYIMHNEAEVQLTHYKEYKSPVFYSFFKAGGAVSGADINIWELLTEDEAKNDQAAKEVEGFLQDKVVLLYLEMQDIDLKSCVGDDCDEKGRQWQFRLKRLFVHKNDAEKIILAGTKAASLDALNSRFACRTLHVGRSTLAVKGGCGQNKLEVKVDLTLDDLNAHYKELIEKSLEKIQKELDGLHKNFWYLLKGRYSQDFFEKPIARMKEFYHEAGHKAVTLQYFYGFLKDVAIAYNEFSSAAFDASAACCIDESVFPMHVMLGEALPSAGCAPSLYRNAFIPSPAIDNEDVRVKKAHFLLERLLAMITGFSYPHNVGQAIRITPSMDKAAPLGKRAMPYYYEHAKELAALWDFDLSRRCKYDEVLSYHFYGAKDAEGNAVHPLERDMDGYGFFRIEGHLGWKAEQALKEVLCRLTLHNIPAKVIALRLTEKDSSLESELNCVFSDLENMYSAMRRELLCFFNAEIAFFAKVKYFTPSTPAQKKPARLLGTLLYKGKPANKLNVFLTPRGIAGRSKGYTAQTGADGKFTIENIEAGTYELGIKGISSVSLFDTRVISYSEEITLEEGGELNLELDLSEPASAAHKNAGNKQEKRKAHEDIGRAGGEYSVGEFYSAHKVSGVSDVREYAMEYVRRTPELAGKVDVENSIFLPAQMIDKIMTARGAAVDKLKDLKPDALRKAQDGVAAFAGTFMEKINKSSAGLSGDSLIAAKEALDRLKRLAALCSFEGLYALCAMRDERAREAGKLTLFGHFLKKHPGVEHLAGVPRGGTFILVHDNGTVVADFALPYVCCSDCPPIAFVLAEPPIVFRLSKTVFCREDSKEYAFVLSPEGGVVAGAGVSQSADGKFVFNPSKAPLGETSLKYEANYREAEFKVNIIEVKADFTFEFLAATAADASKKKVKFTALAQTCDKYEWNFGDGASEVSAREAVHEYAVTETKTFTVSLKAVKGECVDMKINKVTLAYCTAGFKYAVASVAFDPGAEAFYNATVDFTADMQDPAAAYAWNFGDNSPLGSGAKVSHAYRISKQEVFNVKLSVKRDGCSDEKTIQITLKPCVPDFKVISLVPSGSEAVVTFESQTTADEYAWSFDDQQSAVGKKVSRRYALSQTERKAKVSLVIKDGKCTGRITKEIMLPPFVAVEISLDDVRYCSDDAGKHLFTLKPAGGKITADLASAASTVVMEGANWYFKPKGAPAGQIVFTYNSPHNQVKSLTITVDDPPKAEFKIDIEKDVKPVALKDYSITLPVPPIGADRYEWLLNGKKVAEFSSAGAVTVSVKNISVLSNTISLVAYKGRCRTQKDLKVTFLPFNPTVTHPTLLFTPSVRRSYTFTSAGDLVPDDYKTIVLNTNKALSNMEERLRAMEVLPPSAPVATETKAYFASLGADMANPAAIALYASGAKAEEVAAKFDVLFKHALEAAGQVQPARKQAAYNYMLMQMNQLLNLIDMQTADAAQDSALSRLLASLPQRLKAFKDLNIDVNPNGALRNMLKGAADGLEGKPVMLTHVKKTIEAIGG